MLKFRYVVPALLLLLEVQNVFAQTPHWVLMNRPVGSGAHVNGFISNGSKFFAASNIGLFYTTNDGISWIKINNLHGNLAVEQILHVGSSIIATGRCRID